MISSALMMLILRDSQPDLTSDSQPESATNDQAALPDPVSCSSDVHLSVPTVDAQQAAQLAVRTARIRAVRHYHRSIERRRHSDGRQGVDAVNAFLAKIAAWINAGYPEGVPGPDRVPLLALLTPPADQRRGQGRRPGSDRSRRVRPRRHRRAHHPDHRRAAPARGHRAGPGAPGRQGLAAGRSARRRTPRTRKGRHSAPCAVRQSARAAASVAARRGGRARRPRPRMLPVPADDDRQTALLTTSLRAGEEIDDDVAVVVSTSGTTGTPKGAMLTAAALIASAEATHAPARRPRPLAAGAARLSRGGPAGAGAQHRRGHRYPSRCLRASTAAELPAAVEAMGSGRRYASLVAVQLDKALGDARRRGGAGRTRRRADRRRTDARRPWANALRPRAFRWCGPTA